MVEIILIFFLGLLMGLINAISGGAGVFAVPTMLAFGIPPVNALALNRVSDAGTVTGALNGYLKSKSIDWNLAFMIMAPLVIGSFVGTITVVNLPDTILRFVVLAGVFVGIFFLLGKARPVKHKKAKVIGLLLMLVVGILSGALAMAGATFAVLVLVYFFGKDYLVARSTDIVAAIPEILISSTILVLSSTVSVLLIVSMFLGSFIGAWMGSHLAVKHGSRFIRKAMVAIAFLMIAKVIL